MQPEVIFYPFVYFVSLLHFLLLELLKHVEHHHHYIRHVHKVHSLQIVMNTCYAIRYICSLLSHIWPYEQLCLPLVLRDKLLETK